jgi:hypothetical protein
VETQIREKIKVISVFECGEIKPLIFWWRNRIYKVLKTSFSYDKNIGREKIFFFSIETSTSCLEISFNRDSFVWKIEKIY